MNMQIDLEKGIANVGDVSRMKEVMARAKRGDRLVIGFIGGFDHSQGAFPRHRRRATPTVCIHGGKRPFRRRSLSTAMLGSAARHRSSARRVWGRIFWRRDRTL